MELVEKLPSLLSRGAQFRNPRFGVFNETSVTLNRLGMLDSMTMALKGDHDRAYWKKCTQIMMEYLVDLVIPRCTRNCSVQRCFAQTCLSARAAAVELNKYAVKTVAS